MVKKGRKKKADVALAWFMLFVEPIVQGWRAKGALPKEFPAAREEMMVWAGVGESVIHLMIGGQEEIEGARPKTEEEK